MDKNDIITAERLRKVLSYNQETGEFRWINSGRGRKNMIAGNVNNRGYRKTVIDGRAHLLHRLAWLYMTGAWPPHQIDHRDRNKLNNRYENLRLATNAQNNRNHGLKSTNKSGIKGVCWHKQRGKWQAMIRSDGGRIFLGLFDTLAEAAVAYAAAVKKYHGEFARQS